MSRSADGQWPQQGTLTSLSSVGEEDFSSILDLDNFDVNAFGFDTNANEPHGMQGQSEDNSWRGNDGTSGSMGFAPGDLQQFTAEGGAGGLMGQSFSYGMAGIHDPSAYQQHQQQQQQQRQRQNIPPTPNSSHMYPPSGHFNARDFSSLPKQQDGSQYGFTQPQDQSYTPMVTPNTTAPNSAFSFVPDYAIPSSYNMSPLTSPAMYPQNRPDYQLPQSPTHPNSMSNSPMNQTFGEFQEPQEEGRPRKTRKKDANSSATATPVSRPKQPSRSVTSNATGLGGAVSASGGAARNRRGSLTIPTNNRNIRKNPSEPQSAIEFGTNGLHTAPHSPHGSVHASVSPQPLTEALMAPPPKPNTPAGTPKALAGQNHPTLGGAAANAAAAAAHAATPASLMRLQQQQKAAAANGRQDHTPQATATSSPNGDAAMEFLSLPEAAEPVPSPDPKSNKPTLVPAAPQQQTRTQPGSVNASPSINPSIRSPTVKPESSGSGRGSKKRNSTSSHLVSPALRPKISPSIRPMLPAGSALARDTHELLLASKSNYQNLLEGNSLPGVNYPAELSTHLTSKRTSHKIAEQGRRNRINTALQEMQSLLPSALSNAAAKDEPVDAKDLLSTPEGKASSLANGSGSGSSNNGKSASPSGGGGGGTAAAARAAANSAHAGNSKAATVELAIEFIKNLKSQNAEKDAEIERLRKEMAAMKAVAGGSDAGAGEEPTGAEVSNAAGDDPMQTDEDVAPTREETPGVVAAAS